MVVVAIIGLLAALLLPGLKEAREKARRAVCASNLHQWGTTWYAYSQDNSGQLLESFALAGGRYPSPVWKLASSGPGQFNLESIASYVPGVNLNQTNYHGVWVCPSSGMQISTMLYTPQLWFESRYGYYSRVDKWTALASQPTDLTESELRADRLLMSDILFMWSAPQQLYYNHGQHGPSGAYNASGTEWYEFGVPSITGLNELYGDGRVEWKDRSRLNPGAMASSPLSVPCVRGGGVDYSFY